MPTYRITDPQTGRTIKLTGNTPPTGDTIRKAFASVGETKPLPGASTLGFGSTQYSTPDERPANLRQIASDIYTPLLEVGGLTAGGIVAGGAATPETFGLGTIPAATVGGAFGYGAGAQAAKNLDIALGLQEPETLPQAFTGAGKDVLAGAEYEMLGQGFGVVAPPVARAVIRGGKAVGRGVASGIRAARTPIQSARAGIDTAADLAARRMAANQLAKATTTVGSIPEQAAINAAEARALESQVQGLNIPLGQATADPGILALQKQIQSGGGTGQLLASETEAANNAALRSYLAQRLPSGDVDAIMGAVTKRGEQLASRAGYAGQRATQEISKLTESAATPQAAGASLRGAATGVRSGLKQTADFLYSQIPKSTKIDSSPLLSRINEIGGASSSVFKNIPNVPKNIAARAGTGLRPSGGGLGHGLLGEAKPQPITFGELQDFRASVNAAKRATTDDTARFYLNKLSDGIDETLKLAESSGQGSGAAAIRKANTFYRNTYVPSVKQGATSRILGYRATGEPIVDDALVGGEYFRPGLRGVESARSFKTTFGNDPTARQAVRDYASNDLLSNAINPVTGEISAGRVSSWLSKYKNALKELGLERDFRSIGDAVKRAEEVSTAAKRFEKSKFAQLADTADPDKFIEAAFSGSNAKSTANTMKQLKEIAGKDASAINGLKNSFADMLIKRAQLSSQDIAGGRLLSVNDMQRLMAQYEPAMKELYSPAEIAAIKDVQRTIEILSRVNKPIKGFSGSDTYDWIKGAALTQPLNPKWRVIRFALSKLRGELASQTEEYLARAIYDPKVAMELQQIGRSGKGKAADVARDRLLKYIQNNNQLITRYDEAGNPTLVPEELARAMDEGRASVGDASVRPEFLKYRSPYRD